MSERYWVARRKEAKDIEELAWQCHHHQNRYAANRYLTVRNSRVQLGRGEDGRLQGAWDVEVRGWHGSTTTTEPLCGQPLPHREKQPSAAEGRGGEGARGEGC